MHLRWKKIVCMDINESQILITKYNVQKLALLLKYVLWYASWGGPWWMPQWVREKHVIRQSLCGEFYWKRGTETGERERKRENERDRERYLPPQRKGRKRAGVGTACLLKVLFTTVQSQDTACHVWRGYPSAQSPRCEAMWLDDNSMP